MMLVVPKEVAVPKEVPSIYDLSCIMRKPVLGVSEQIRHKQCCTEDC